MKKLILFLSIFFITNSTLCVKREKPICDKSKEQPVKYIVPRDIIFEIFKQLIIAELDNPDLESAVTHINNFFKENKVFKCKYF